MCPNHQKKSYNPQVCTAGIHYLDTMIQGDLRWRIKGSWGPKNGFKRQSQAKYGLHKFNFESMHEICS